MLRWKAKSQWRTHVPGQEFSGDIVFRWVISELNSGKELEVKAVVVHCQGKAFKLEWKITGNLFA